MMENEVMFNNRDEFRNWLIENHATSSGIWMVFGKGRSIKTIKAEEALEEALCFGWIDGQLSSVDEEKYLKKFTPRRKGSHWTGIIEFYKNVNVNEKDIYSIIFRCKKRRYKD